MYAQVANRDACKLLGEKYQGYSKYIYFFNNITVFQILFLNLE